MEFVKEFFEEKFVEDHRSPVFSWRVQWMKHPYELNLFLPNYRYTMVVFLTIVFQMAVASFLATVMYYGIVQPQQENQQSNLTVVKTNQVGNKERKKRAVTTTSLQGFLIGYGFVVPFSLLFPFYMVDILDVQNLGFRMSWALVPGIVTFRCLEAMYGFVKPTLPPSTCSSAPPSKTSMSLWDYVVSVGLFLQPKYDKATGKTIPCTPQHLRHVFLHYWFYVICFAMVYHVSLPFNFYPFCTTSIVGRWYNTFVQAFLLNLNFSFSFAGLSVVASVLAGIEFEYDLTHFPLVLSNSPTDFWSRRWNNLVHFGLKQGVYKPVRFYFTKNNSVLAAMAAFLASGIYHEYVWKLLFIPTTIHQQGNFLLLDAPNSTEAATGSTTLHESPWFGKQLIFFGWNGMFIALEFSLVGKKIAKIIKTMCIPPFLKSHLLVLLALPFGYLMTDDLTKAGYFESLQQVIPMIQIK